jgi:hypothetical protein
MECASSAANSGIFRLDLVIPGVRYQLHRSTDLDSWDPVAEVTYETAGPGPISDPRPLARNGGSTG